MCTGRYSARKRSSAKLWRLALVTLLLAVSLSSCSHMQPAGIRAERAFRSLEDRIDAAIPRWIAPIDRALDELAIEMRLLFSRFLDGLSR